jgi:hypothetical protein
MGAESMGAGTIGAGRVAVPYTVYMTNYDDEMR